MPRYAIRDEGVTVEGLAAIQRVLARIGHEAAGELREKLKAIGRHTKAAAQTRAPTGRTGRLKATIRVSVTRSSASVYSGVEYGGVQNVGGKVGRDHKTVLTRASVSGYMVKAVQSESDYINKEVEALAEWLLRVFTS